MRRSIYSSDESTKFGVITIVTNGNQSVESVSAIANLDATGTSTTIGSISTYEWSIITGTGLILDTPNSVSTSVSGTSVLGESLIQVKVTDSNGNVAYETLTITIVLGTPLSLTKTFPVSGAGTITFADGQPSEVLNLEFRLLNGDAPDAMSFTGGIVFGALSYLNPTAVGQITLDGSGGGTSDYSAIGAYFQVEVTITGRSSSYPLTGADLSEWIPIYTI